MNGGEFAGPFGRRRRFEPITLLTAVAQYTKNIGLLATATTTYDEPYSLARRYASLDHLSKGRACWNIVTTSYPDDSLNFSRTEHVAKDTRYERANEFVEICNTTSREVDLSDWSFGQGIYFRFPAEREPPSELTGSGCENPFGIFQEAAEVIVEVDRVLCRPYAANPVMEIPFFGKGELVPFDRRSEV